MLWPLDALLRTSGVTGTVDSLSNSKVHSEYTTSLLSPLIVGAVVSSGGGVIIGAISGTTANWAFNTPPFLRHDAGWDVTLDIWGGALVGKFFDFLVFFLNLRFRPAALVYGVLIGHAPFSSIRSFLNLGKPLSRPVAKVYASTIWGILFAAKAYKIHGMAQPKVPRANNHAENHELRMKKRK